MAETTWAPTLSTFVITRPTPPKLPVEMSVISLHSAADRYMEYGSPRDSNIPFSAPSYSVFGLALSAST